MEKESDKISPQYMKKLKNKTKKIEPTDLPIKKVMKNYESLPSIKTIEMSQKT